MTKLQSELFLHPPVLPSSRIGRQYAVPAHFDLLVCALLVIVLIPVFLETGVKMSFAMPLALLIGLSCRKFFQIAFNQKETDIFSPATLVSAYFLAYFALRGFYLASVPFVKRVGNNSYDDYLVTAMWCACAGFVAFSFGHNNGVGKQLLRRLPVTRMSWPRSVPVLRILIVLVIGLACQYYLFKTGQVVGNFQNPSFQRNPPPGMVVLLVGLIDQATIVTLLFLFLTAKAAQKPATWLLLGACIFALVLRLAITGGKQAMIQPLLEATIVIHYGWRRLKLWELVAIGLPTLVMAFGIVNYYRFSVVGTRGSPKSFEDLVSRVSDTSTLLSSKSSNSSRRSALDQMVDRNAGLDSLALVMKYTPRPFGYAYGKDVIKIPITFIPRQLWKNKPVNMPSFVFEQTYMGEPPNFDGFSSVHLISDFYRNFSLIGLLAGMFAFGAILRAFYLFCDPSPGHGAGIFLFAIVFPDVIHSLEQDIGTAIVYAMRLALLAIVVAVFLGVKFQKKRAIRLPLLSVASQRDVQQAIA